jgi:hypothetical protein
MTKRLVISGIVAAWIIGLAAAPSRAQTTT